MELSDWRGNRADAGSRVWGAGTDQRLGNRSRTCPGAVRTGTARPHRSQTRSCARNVLPQSPEGRIFAQRRRAIAQRQFSRRVQTSWWFAVGRDCVRRRATCARVSPRSRTPASGPTPDIGSQRSCPIVALSHAPPRRRAPNHLNALRAFEARLATSAMLRRQTNST